jgi:hypothetical protein
MADATAARFGMLANMDVCAWMLVVRAGGLAVCRQHPHTAAMGQ